MQEADMSLTNQAMGRTEERAMVQFFMHTKKNGPKSDAAGRDIFESVEYIKIMTPGNKDNIPVSPVTIIHKRRFPTQYKRWLENRDEEVGIEGTLLSEWPGVSRTQVEELKFFHIHTVEQLCEMSDVNAQGFMGINMLRERAKAFLAASDKQAVINEREDLKAANAMLAEQVRELAATVKTLTESNVPRETRKYTKRGPKDMAKDLAFESDQADDESQ